MPNDEEEIDFPDDGGEEEARRPRADSSPTAPLHQRARAAEPAPAKRPRGRPRKHPIQAPPPQLPVPKQVLSREEDDGLDPESREMNQRIRERNYIEQQRGDRRQSPSQEIDAASMYAINYERWASTGRLIVELKGALPETFTATVPAIKVPNWGSLIEYCKQRWYKGDRLVVKWGFRLGAEWRGRGELEIEEDPIEKIRYQGRLQVAEMEERARVEETKARIENQMRVARGEAPIAPPVAAPVPALPPIPPPAPGDDPRVTAMYQEMLRMQAELAKVSATTSAQQQVPAQQHAPAPAAPVPVPTNDPAIGLVLQQMHKMSESIATIAARQDARERLEQERIQRRAYGLDDPDDDIFESRNPTHIAAPAAVPTPPGPPPPPIPDPGYTIVRINSYPGWALMRIEDAQRMAAPAVAAAPAIPPPPPPAAPAAPAAAPTSALSGLQETMAFLGDATKLARNIGKTVGLVEPDAAIPPPPPPPTAAAAAIATIPAAAAAEVAPPADPYFQLGTPKRPFFVPKGPDGDVEDNLVKFGLMNIPTLLSFLGDREAKKAKHAAEELELRRQAAIVEAYEADAKARAILAAQGRPTMQAPLPPPPPIQIPEEDEDDEEEEEETPPPAAAPPAPANGVASGVANAIGAIGTIGGLGGN